MSKRRARDRNSISRKSSITTDVDLAGRAEVACALTVIIGIDDADTEALIFLLFLMLFNR